MGVERYAIPSRSRVGICERSTLALLRRLGVPDDDIDLWVVPDQMWEYAGLGPNVREVTDTVGLRGARNSIAAGYPKGTRLIEMDDDATAMYIGWRGHELVEVDPETWDTVREHAWEQCRKLGIALWGSYPVCNDYFMRPVATTDLRRVSGGLFGYTVRGDDAETLTVDEKEDYERTIRFFLRDGGVLRLNWLTLRVGYMTGAGGMSDYRTVDSDRAGAKRICQMYPKLTRYVDERGTRGTGEVDLLRKGGVSSPIPMPRGLRDAADLLRPSRPVPLA